MHKIEQLASNLLELKQKAERTLKGGDMGNWISIIAEQMFLLKELQKILLTKSSIEKIKNPGLKRMLDEIDLGDIEDIEEACLQMLYSWFLPQEYVLRLAEIKSLLTSISIPERLKRFISEARQCYASQQPNAVYSLSRTILEAAINDICVRAGRMPKRCIQKDDFRDLPFNDRLSRLVSEKDRSKIHTHYQSLCRVIHGSISIDDNEALRGLMETLGYVRHLYDVHQHIIKD